MKHTETSTTSYRPQLTLPGQAHTAEGPHDQTGMYVMHHALRRDFDRFAAAVEGTPIAEHEVWAALERALGRDGRRAAPPPLRRGRRAVAAAAAARGGRRRRGRTSGCSPTWRPSTTTSTPRSRTVRDAFAAMSEHPCTDHRNALEIRLGAAHELLLSHLAHEEQHALPMLQRTLSEEENAAFEKAVEKRYPLRSIPFLLPWAMDERAGRRPRAPARVHPTRLRPAPADLPAPLRARRTPRLPVRLRGSVITTLGSGHINPCSYAYAAAAVRERTSSLVKMLERWRATVFSERTRPAAIWGLVRPVATRRSTSTSRG